DGRAGLCDRRLGDRGDGGAGAKSGEKLTAFHLVLPESHQYRSAGSRRKIAIQSPACRAVPHVARMERVRRGRKKLRGENIPPDGDVAKSKGRNLPGSCHAVALIMR